MHKKAELVKFRPDRGAGGGHGGEEARGFSGVQVAVRICPAARRKIKILNTNSKSRVKKTVFFSYN